MSGASNSRSPRRNFVDYNRYTRRSQISNASSTEPVQQTATPITGWPDKGARHHRAAPRGVAIWDQATGISTRPCTPRTRHAAFPRGGNPRSTWLVIGVARSQSCPYRERASNPRRIVKHEASSLAEGRFVVSWSH